MEKKTHLVFACMMCKYKIEFKRDKRREPMPDLITKEFHNHREERDENKR